MSWDKVSDFSEQNSSTLEFASRHNKSKLLYRCKNWPTKDDTAALGPTPFERSSMIPVLIAGIPGGTIGADVARLPGGSRYGSLEYIPARP